LQAGPDTVPPYGMKGANFIEPDKFSAQQQLAIVDIPGCVL
jgi:hypothetical protein